MSKPDLHAILHATLPSEEGGESDLERILGPRPWEECVAIGLALWLELVPDAPLPGRDDVRSTIALAIVGIDETIGRQLDAILHHPKFQALEGAWRGLRYLVGEVPEDDNAQVRVLDVSWRELSRDLERAIEFDQSHLYRLVYNEEFGMPGGEPYGVLLGDYYVRHRPGADSPIDDVGTLRAISQVAAAAFAPFVASAHPSLLGLDRFADLQRPIDFSRAFEGPEYTHWNSLRKSEDARFVGLTLPRVLLRLPYRDDPLRADGFVYREDVSAPDGAGYLFGNATFAFGEVLLRAFERYRWLAAIRGVQRDRDGQGLVEGLPYPSHDTEPLGLVPKGPLEVEVTDQQEKQLGDLGLIPLVRCHGTGYAAFHGNQSIQRWTRGAQSSAGAETIEMNAKLSSMLQYMLCVSRFAHYVKVIGRDRVGSYTNAMEIQSILENWLLEYANANEDVDPELQARHPLREASVEVREVPGQPGVFGCVVRLRPHFQLDQMTTAVQLVTELFAGREV